MTSWCEIARHRTPLCPSCDRDYNPRTVSHFIRRPLHGQMCFLVSSNPTRIGSEDTPRMPALPLAAVDSCSSDVKGGKEGAGGGSAQLQNVFFPLPIIRYFRAAATGGGVPFVAISPIRDERGRGREGGRKMRSPAIRGGGEGRQMIDRTVRQPLMETPPTTRRHNTRCVRTVHELPRCIEPGKLGGTRTQPRFLH